MGSPGAHRWAWWGVGKTSWRNCISTEPWSSAEAEDRGGQGKVSRVEGIARAMAQRQRGLGSCREQNIALGMGTWVWGQRWGNHAPTLHGAGRTE